MALRHERLGSIHQAAGRFNDARRFFLKWYRLTNESVAALRLADVCRQLENFKSAVHWYQVALHLARRAKVSQDVSDAYLGLAMCERGIQKFPSAIRLLTASLLSYEKSHDSEGAAYALWALGTTQRFAGRLIQAESNLRRSIARYKKIDDPSGLAYAMCGLGGTLRMRGKYVESFSLYKKASKTFVRFRDRFGEAYSNCGQGNALRMQGKLSAALPFMKKAERLYRQLGQKGPLGFVLWSRGQWELERNNVAMARRFFFDAKKIFKKVKDRRGILYCDLGFAEILRLKNKPDFRRVFRRITTTAQALGLPLEKTYALARIKNQKRPCKIIKIP